MPDLQRAYDACRSTTAEYAKTFYLGSMLLPMAKRRAIWAIYAWCRNTDELVDGTGMGTVTIADLERWETRTLQTLQGNPPDDSLEDLALADVAQQFPLTAEPFVDLIAGMRMDLTQNRYATFAELETYCYRVAGTVGLMSAQIMGYETGQDGTEEAISLGIALQLTNILRDVGEDYRRGRIYLPLEDLQKFGYSEDDLGKYINDQRWKALMEFEIQRAYSYYEKAERGIITLQRDSRFPVWASLIHYRKILKKIQANRYQNFVQRAYVSKTEKFISLPAAWLKAQ
jgi:15-cis-phytoene synthase